MIFAAFSQIVASQVNSENVVTGQVSNGNRPIQVAYLAENRFDLQNNFLANFLGHLEKIDNQFSFELQSFSSEVDLVNCLATGSCLASLDYSYKGKIQSDLRRRLDSGTEILQSSTGAEVLPLPILDDPVLSVTMPQYGQAFIQSVVVFAFWVVGIYGLFVLFFLLVTSPEKFSKPERADVRTTPLMIQ